MKKLWVKLSVIYFCSIIPSKASIDDAIKLSEKNPIQALQMLDNIRFKKTEDEVTAYNSVMLIFAMNDMDKYLEYLETRKNDSRYKIWGFMNAGMIKYAKDKKEACEWTLKIEDAAAQQATKTTTCRRWISENKQEYSDWVNTLKDPMEKKRAQKFLQYEDRSIPLVNCRVLKDVENKAQQKNIHLYIDVIDHIDSNEAEDSLEQENNQKYVGKWKMTSWDGDYELFKNGKVTISNDATKSSGGLWFNAYGRLYLVWKDSPDVDVFKLNDDEKMIFERIDNRAGLGVQFQKQ